MLRAEAKRAAPRPLVQGDRSPTEARDTRPVWCLTAGFLLSSVTLFAILYAVAQVSGVEHVASSVRAALAIGQCTLWCVVDLWVTHRRRACSVGPRRQTGKNFVYRYGARLGAFMWGLDTGLAVTTFRMVSLTWAVVGLSLLGLTPWWL